VGEYDVGLGKLFTARVAKFLYFVRGTVERHPLDFMFTVSTSPSETTRRYSARWNQNERRV